MSASSGQGGSGSKGTLRGLIKTIALIVILASPFVAALAAGLFSIYNFANSIQDYQNYYESVVGPTFEKYASKTATVPINNNVTNYSFNKYYYNGVDNESLIKTTTSNVDSVFNDLKLGVFWYWIMIGLIVIGIVVACKSQPHGNNQMRKEETTESTNRRRLVSFILILKILSGILMILFVVLAMVVFLSVNYLMSFIVNYPPQLPSNLTLNFLRQFQGISPEYYAWIIEAQLFGIDIILLVIIIAVESKSDDECHQKVLEGEVDLPLPKLVVWLVGYASMINDYLTLLLKFFVLVSIAFALGFTLLAFYNGLFLYGYLSYSSLVLATTIVLVLMVLPFQFILRMICKLCSLGKPQGTTASAVSGKTT